MARACKPDAKFVGASEKEAPDVIPIVNSSGETVHLRAYVTSEDTWCTSRCVQDAMAVGPELILQPRTSGDLSINGLLATELRSKWWERLRTTRKPVIVATTGPVKMAGRYDCNEFYNTALGLKASPIPFSLEKPSRTRYPTMVATFGPDGVTLKAESAGGAGKKMVRYTFRMVDRSSRKHLLPRKLSRSQKKKFEDFLESKFPLLLLKPKLTVDYTRQGFIVLSFPSDE